MSANAWLITAIVGFSLSGAALVAAVIMFIKMNIPSVIGNLTGRTVAREIKTMREINTASGDKRFRPSAVNLERGKLTDTIRETSAKDIALAHVSKRLDKTDETADTGTRKTKTGTNKLTEAANKQKIQTKTAKLSIPDTDATEVLSDNATEELDNNATEVLDNNATEVLDGYAEKVPSKNTSEATAGGAIPRHDGTTVLSDTDRTETKKPVAVPFRITHDEVVFHSDEVIK